MYRWHNTTYLVNLKHTQINPGGTTHLLRIKTKTCRVLIARQWIALAMLALGVGLVQVSRSDDEEKDPKDGQNPLLGFVAVMMSCCTSGFAGVYFEKVSRRRL